MRDWYDQPQVADILIEQGERLPYGPLGVLMPPKVEVEDRDAEVLTLWAEYMAGKVPTMEFMTRAEELKTKRNRILTR